MTTPEIAKVKKRDGSIADFEQDRITKAIYKALTVTGEGDEKTAEKLSERVVKILNRRFSKREIPEVEQIQDIVEEVLMLEDLTQTAKAYIIYREQRRRMREAETIYDEAVEIYDKYIQEVDWQVKENANMAYSLQGLNNYGVATLTKRYWLNKIYPQQIREAMQSGDFHIHDLDFLGAYCCGWDLYDLLKRGFGGVRGKVESKPPKHLQTALGQVVNFFYTLQGECYSGDTQVLTDRGWKYFYNVAKDDKIFTLNNQTNEIELQTPLRFYEFDYNGELYNFKTKKLDLMITPNHNMAVDQYCPNCTFEYLQTSSISGTYQNDYLEPVEEESNVAVLPQIKTVIFGKNGPLYYRRFVKAKDFNPNQHFIPKTSIWRGKEQKFFILPSLVIKQYRNFSNQYQKVILPAKNILTDDWLAFFGFWLAEGNVYCRTRKRIDRRKPYYEYSVRIFQNQGKIEQEFETILARLPFHYRKKIGKNNLVVFEITDKQLFSYLEQFGNSGSKFIPAEIKGLCCEQLKILFNWMMKGDGHQSNGLVEYSTKSVRLADDMQEIALKLGWSANVYPRHKGKFSWFDVGISRAKHFRFRSADNIQKVNYQGKVYCLEVPNHTLYVRRVGKACWCGNSAGAQAFSNFDTLLAPFIRYDKLDYKDVKQAMQEFLFGCAVPTRVGFQCLSEDTEILSIYGWKKYHEIKEGEIIKTFNIERGVIEDRRVNNIFQKEYRGVMYNLKTSKQDQLISPGHRVVIRRDDSFFIQPIEDILKMNSPVYIPVVLQNEEIELEEVVPETIKAVDYQGIIWCPNTENETVIAKRNGQVFITGNTPFSNITIDIKPSPSYVKQPVIIGGEPQQETYGEFEEEMKILNRAFFEAMSEGDKNSRIFTFPIPTINITQDFPWDEPFLEPMWLATAKYGVNYFANFIQSDMKPEDVRSMCCRLRISNKELLKKGGGLFGANPLTGSQGVITINMSRIGYLSKTKKEFFERLERVMDLAKESLEIKRRAIDDLMRKGLYPYSKHYLEGVEKMRGSHYGNHFSTIGILGMNECLLNFMGEDIGSDEGRKFALEVMDFMRDKIIKFQEETGSLYNLESTPAEGASYRLALKDKEKYPDIITAGTKEVPYYTNSSLPYSEKILIDGVLVEIGKFVEEHLERDTTDHYTFSYHNGRIIKSKVLGVVRHEPKSTLFLITTKSGRQIKVTGNHSVFWFNPETGNVEPKIVYDFCKGDSIIVFKGPFETSDLEFIESSKIVGMPITKSEDLRIGFAQRNHSLVNSQIQLDYNFGFICGINQSDGSILNSENPERIAERVSFCFDNNKEINAEKVATQVQEITDARPCFSFYSTYTILDYHSRNFAFLCKGLGLQGKRIPEAVLRGSRECKVGYLDGFIVGDGYVNIDDVKRYHRIVISQNQRETLSDISLVLTSLGIYHTINGPNKRGIFNLNICRGGLKVLADLSKLANMKVVGEHIKDSLPCNFGVVEHLVKRYSQGKKWRVLNELGAEEKYVGTKKIQEFCQHKHDDRLSDLLDGFLIDTVKEIEEITEPGYHYDISTQYGNFYGRDGVLCHNTQLPVNYTDDVFKAVELQDELQCKYTGGTVLHLFVGEQISDIVSMKNLIKKIFSNYKLPYITLTPTFSVCPSHGYLSGEHWQCPKCTIEQPCEVYSRVVGYIRPVQQWHKGKAQEFKERKEFVLPENL